MLQRQFRLRHSADFEQVRRKGRVWRHPLVQMTVAPNEFTHNRFGFVTSRHLGGAVVRNRVRRILREVVRLEMSRLKTGYDITFVARNEIVDQPYNRVTEAIDELFKRARLLADLTDVAATADPR